jgi:hemoglobin/transferrin/lactoferrin receptor protein
LTADVAKKIKAHELRYGIDAWYNDVASTAFGTNIFSGDEAPVSTRYASGGSQMYSLAAYLTHTWEINDRLIVNDGLRYSHVGLNALFNDTTFFQFPFSEVNQQNGALTGMIGLNYLPSNSTRINVLFSTGFRAPNVDDMSKVFDSSPGNVIIPNESLKP